MSRVQLRNLGFMVRTFIFLVVIIISAAQAHAEPRPLRVGITAVLIEQDINLNQQVAEYIGKRLNAHVDVVYRKSYREINDMLGRAEIDVAFVCGYAYIAGRDDIGLDLLAVPIVKGKPLYRSYVIVPSASEDRDLSDLRGKRYAFTDPLSNSGYLVPVFWLSRKGENPETFFKKHIFTRAHYNSIEAVAMRIVDGASVDSYIWEHAKKTNPQLVSRTRVIKESGLLPFPPVVARRGLDEKIKAKVREVLLSMNKDPDGKEILREMGLDGFVAVKDEFYSPIREMRNRVRAGHNSIRK